MADETTCMFKKLAIKQFPKLGDDRQSSETRFWGRYKQQPLIVREFSAVTTVDFCPTLPHDYAVTSGSRVQIYNSDTNLVKRTISRFKETAYSARFRHDGRLLLTGSEEGVVKLFDLNNRLILRQFSGHSKPVKCVQFTSNGLEVVSGCDDTVVRVWDMSTGDCSSQLRHHTDYVRCVSAIPSNQTLVLSGSYDHSVTLWDLRSGESVMTCDHGAPVEAMLVFPSGAACLTAGDNYIKVWDLLAGGKLLAAFSNHQKTITTLCFDGSCRRLLSGGLDRQLKVYNLEDYKVVHSISYPSPILSLSMSPTDSHLVVGMTNRLLSIRHSAQQQQKDVHAPFGLFGMPSFQRTPGSYRYFVRGRSYKPEPEEHLVPFKRKRRKMREYDSCLKKFQYKKALDAALNVDRNAQNRPLIIYSLLQELARRNGLSTAVSGRTEEELEPLLKYLCRNFPNPRYTPLLLDVCHIMIDVYGRTVYRSKMTRALFSALKAKVDHEVQVQKRAYALLGSLDTILTAALVQRQKQHHDNPQQQLKHVHVTS